MFEYLMPLLFMRTYDNSLLDMACREAVRQQIAVWDKTGVPWGISESRLQRHGCEPDVPVSGLRRSRSRAETGAGMRTWSSRRMPPCWLC